MCAICESSIQPGLKVLYKTIQQQREGRDGGGVLVYVDHTGCKLTEIYLLVYFWSAGIKGILHHAQPRC